ncbi:MAG: response regulator, partial [Acidobacteriaceae bacterium]|nr:response regulator [Acidobacteriaceae bacterium]
RHSRTDDFEGASQGSRGAILLAEDNLINQKVALHMLRRLGFDVDVATNGRDAIDMFQLKNYDLILMDCQMPEMDGFEAASAIRELESPGNRIPIIAATANAFSEDQARCLSAGMDDHLPKPIAMESLNLLLQRWLPSPVNA